LSSVPASPLRPLPGSVTSNKKNTGNYAAKSPVVSEIGPPLVEYQSVRQKLCTLLTFGKVDGRAGSNPEMPVKRLIGNIAEIATDGEKMFDFGR
jgi:hypothetical protein